MAAWAGCSPAWKQGVFPPCIAHARADTASRLVHEDGFSIDADEISAEIYVRGPSLMQGYLGNAEASSGAFDEDGWLRTGDIAYRYQGKYWIVDRKKVSPRPISPIPPGDPIPANTHHIDIAVDFPRPQEMIKVRGWQVSPAELEAALRLHPDISDAAVVGTYLRHGDTEVPRAYVVKAPGSDSSSSSSSSSNVSERDVKRFMASRVARYKNLDGGVAFVDAIPRSSAGKILRNILKDRAAAEANDGLDSESEHRASTVFSAKQLSDTGRVSLDSTVTSYDGTVDSDRSRRNSASTATSAVPSEATGWTKSVRSVVSANGGASYDMAMQDATSPIGSRSGPCRNEDLTSSPVFPAFSSRTPDAQALPVRPSFSRLETVDLEYPRVPVNSPAATHHTTRPRAYSTPGFNAMAMKTETKKRAADDLEDVECVSKKLKTEPLMDRSDLNPDGK